MAEHPQPDGKGAPSPSEEAHPPKSCSGQYCRWGIYRTDETTHIAPCDTEGYLEPPHQLTPDCTCQPIAHHHSSHFTIYAHNRFN